MQATILDHIAKWKKKIFLSYILMCARGYENQDWYIVCPKLITPF